MLSLTVVHKSLVTRNESFAFGVNENADVPKLQSSPLRQNAAENQKALTP